VLRIADGVDWPQDRHLDISTHRLAHQARPVSLRSEICVVGKIHAAADVDHGASAPRELDHAPDAFLRARGAVGMMEILAPAIILAFLHARSRLRRRRQRQLGMRASRSSSSGAPASMPSAMITLFHRRRRGDL